MARGRAGRRGEAVSAPEGLGQGKEENGAMPQLGQAAPVAVSAPISPGPGGPAQPARHGQAVKFSYTSVD